MNDPATNGGTVKCPICKHEDGEHALSCPTRWYPKAAEETRLPVSA